MTSQTAAGRPMFQDKPVNANKLRLKAGDYFKVVNGEWHPAPARDLEATWINAVMCDQWAEFAKTRDALAEARYQRELENAATEFQCAPEDVEDAAGTETSRDADAVRALVATWRAEHEAAEVASMAAIRDAERRNESILAGEYHGTLPGDEAEDAADREYAELVARHNPPHYAPLDDEPHSADQPGVYDADELPF